MNEEIKVNIQFNPSPLSAFQSSPEEFTIERNNLTDISSENYRRNRGNASDAKIIILGNRNVGKSSIVKAFIENTSQKAGSIAKRESGC